MQKSSASGARDPVRFGGRSAFVLVAACTLAAGCAELEKFGTIFTAKPAAEAATSQAAEPPPTPPPAAPPPPEAKKAERPPPIPLSRLMKRPGGFYNDDAPDGPPPVDLEKIPDAVPRAETMNWRANEPYTVYGREYAPYKAVVEYRRQGTISWYGRKFHGQRTWSGEVYDMYAMTAAHPTLPIPSYVRIVNLENRRSVVVRVNDRGPFLSGRVMDVSYAAAYRLGFADSGTATVEVEAIATDGVAIAPVEPPQSPQQTALQPATPAAPTPPAKPATRKPAPTATTAKPAPPKPTPAAIDPPKVQTARVDPPKPEPAKQEPPEPDATFTTTADAPGIFLQLGAFGAPQNAESFRSKVQPQLAEEKLAAQIVERDKLFRVQIGPFRTRQEAAQTAEKLREPLGIRPLVVVR